MPGLDGPVARAVWDVPSADVKRRRSSPSRTGRKPSSSVRWMPHPPPASPATWGGCSMKSSSESVQRVTDRAACVCSSPAVSLPVSPPQPAAITPRARTEVAVRIAGMARFLIVRFLPWPRCGRSALRPWSGADRSS